MRRQFIVSQLLLSNSNLLFQKREYINSANDIHIYIYIYRSWHFFKQKRHFSEELVHSGEENISFVAKTFP